MTLRMFDSTGTHAWTAGAEGDGPEEFRWPLMVTGFQGDSLIVCDPATNRLSIFTAQGLFARAATLSDLPGSNRCVGLSGPDWILTEHRSGERTSISGHDAYTYHLDLYLVDLNGEVIESLGRWFFARDFQEVDSRGAYSPAIFDSPTVVAASPEGFWYGDTESYELRRGTADTDVERILRWQGPDLTISESDVEAVLEIWAGGPSASPDLRRFIREYGRTHPRADRFPAYDQAHTDMRGQLWVRDFVREHLDDGLRRWTIFSSDGVQVTGRLTHSERFRPLEMGGDWILGVETDELDIERILVRRIVR